VVRRVCLSQEPASPERGCRLEFAKPGIHMSDDTATLSRRGLIQAAGIGLAGASLAAGGAQAAGPLPPSPLDTGRVEGGKVVFPNWRGEADQPSPPPPAPLPPEQRIGIAIVGLGRLSLEEILPAFTESKRVKPVALVSGSPEKAKAVAAQYGIKPDAIYDYASFDRIAENPAIQAVYIVLPNAMHHEFVLRAARAGKHVLCEKPMAVSSAQAREMTAACKAANVKLMIAYRIQYEPHNREAMRLLRSGELGPVKFIDAINTQVQGDPDQWRMKHAMAGGGSLPDIGLYCLNSTRAYLGEEPNEVFARIWSTPNDPRFREVEENVSFMLRFPSGIVANCFCGYGAHDGKPMRVHLEKAWIDIESAFAYEGQSMRIGHRAGRHTSIDEVKVGMKNQFALEMDHFGACIALDRQPHTPGEEGVQDHVVMEAIYESARTGQPVKLPEIKGLDTTRGPAPDPA
jgi:predicted dehydrogenase